MTETKKILCENCGKEVKNTWDLDRYGECTACKAVDRATDMGVGDAHAR